MPDIVATTIAVLFDPLDSVPGISEQELSQLVRRPLAIGHTLEGVLVVSSNRDQAEIHLALNKLDVRDLTGNVAESKTRIPGLLRKFHGLSPIRTPGLSD